MRDSGCPHSQGEAAFWLSCFFENSGFEAEEFYLVVDVEVSLLDGLGCLFDYVQGSGVVSFADEEFDRKVCEEEGCVNVTELDGLELRKEVFCCHIVVAGKMSE